MDIETVKFFFENITSQYQEMKAELKQELKSLGDKIDQRFGKYDQKLEEHEKRLSKVEQINWRVTAAWMAVVGLVQLGVTIVLEMFIKK